MFSSSGLLFALVLILPCTARIGEVNIDVYREKIKRMFYHAYEGYLTHAYPFDELQPLTCSGHDTWGSYSLTLIDAMDTLAVMGNYSEFRRIAHILIDKGESFFDIDINVSVFETNIRIVGGLLSAHLMMKRAGMVLEPAWPCSGPLLRMADSIARKILPAFDTPTGMPYGTVNLRHGVPKGETTVTCTAGVGTFLVEFGSLSRLTGDPIFEKTAVRAMRALWKYRSQIGLLGNHIDVSNGKWTALDSGIGGGIDSYFEYLVKGAMMFNMPELLHMFREYEAAVDHYLKRDDWYMWAQMNKGSITMPLFTSLDGYWPGVKALLGDVDEAMKTLHNFHQVWRQFGFSPEYYNIPKAEVHQGREGYPLRPELVESAMYLYRTTKDPFLLQFGVDVIESIEYSARTSCGYATVKDVRDHRLEDRMESFFLAETTKYLYLLFDPDNFIHNNGSHGYVVDTPNGSCVLEAGGYIFNTEAHPIDLASVHCCSAEKKEQDRILEDFHNNLDLLSLLDLTDMDDRKEDIQERRKLRKWKKEQDKQEHSGDKVGNENEKSLKFRSKENILPEETRNIENEDEILEYDETDDSDDEDFDDFDDFDDEENANNFVSQKNKEEKALHVIDMTRFTEAERNFTRIFLEEFQMGTIMKNISAQIAHKLEQEFKETEYEHTARDIAKKILENAHNNENNVAPHQKSGEDEKDTNQNEKDDGTADIQAHGLGAEDSVINDNHSGTENNDLDIDESVAHQRLLNTSEEKPKERSSHNAVHVEVKAEERQQSHAQEAKSRMPDLSAVQSGDMHEDKDLSSQKDISVSERESFESEKGMSVSEKGISVDENRVDIKVKTNDDSTQGGHNEESQSAKRKVVVLEYNEESDKGKLATEETLQKEDSSKHESSHTESPVPNPVVEKFKSYLDDQLQQQHDLSSSSSSSSLSSSSSSLSSETSVPGTQSPLEKKRTNIFSITKKLLTLISGGSGDEEKKKNIEQLYTPSIGGLYLALANYSLKYFHDPAALHCSAQAFHDRASVYGEMFPRK